MSKPVTIHLVVIDPQNDFCDPKGSLYVTGADADMDRLADMVHRIHGKLDDIHVTLDSHRKVDIAHPIWWKDSSGARPNPFTIITAADVADGKWTTYMPSFHKRSLEYLRELEASGRYPHCIWPPHCLIGSWGHNIYQPFYDALQVWEDSFATVDYVTKGSNIYTEHFSAVTAEVPDPEDPTTQMNTAFVQTLENADIILLAGEALSHCVANTLRDTANAFSNPKYIEKVHLLVDASSSVPGFEHLGEAFVKEFTAKGMKTTTTVDFLK
jgi:nicotinamidase/pyrazinamidase